MPWDLRIMETEMLFMHIIMIEIIREGRYHGKISD